MSVTHKTFISCLSSRPTRNQANCEAERLRGWAWKPLGMIKISIRQTVQAAAAIAASRGVSKISQWFSQCFMFGDSAYKYILLVESIYSDRNWYPWQAIKCNYTFLALYYCFRTLKVLLCVFNKEKATIRLLLSKYCEKHHEIMLPPQLVAPPRVAPQTQFPGGKH